MEELQISEGLGLGAGLGAIGFWLFIAAVVVAGIWFYVRKREAEHETLRRMIDESGRNIDLEVDGGINENTARQAISAGADVLVAGTATFTGGPDRYADNINGLRNP